MTGRVGVAGGVQGMQGLVAEGKMKPRNAAEAGSFCAKCDDAQPKR